MAHVFNPSTWVTEAGRSLGIRGQPSLQNEFQDGHSYTEKPCLKRQNKTKQSKIKMTHFTDTLIFLSYGVLTSS